MSIGSGAITDAIVARGRKAEHVADIPPDRTRSTARLLDLARPGDRVVIMGARDDTLTLFAEDLLAKLAR
jgi:UDP-N-acetylmuramate--alanine ligase